jgi:HEPN domain-containing protein
VTTKDVIAHWRKGAKGALRVAKLAQKDGEQELVLFHCHLAVEKALKAAIMEQTGKPDPKVHNLSHLASLLHENWTADDRILFTTLSEFATAARYDDPAWAQRFATAQNAKLWINRTSTFLSHLGL